MEQQFMKTLTYKVVIPIDRQLKITVPEDVPPGPAEIVVVTVPEAVAERGGPQEICCDRLCSGSGRTGPILVTVSNMPESCEPRRSSAVVSSTDQVMDTDGLIEILFGNT